MDSWYWRVSVHAEDDIRFAFKVLGYSTADLVLLFDRALPIGRRCDIRVIAPNAGQYRACREIVFRAEVVLVVFGVIGVRVTFRMHSLSEEAISLLGKQTAESPNVIL